MQKYYELLDEIAGPPKYGEHQQWTFIESRQWNRRNYILSRRSLRLERREDYDAFVRFALSWPIAAWSGSLDLGYSDLADLVEQGWTRPSSG